jgi:hypothetical protein
MPMFIPARRLTVHEREPDIEHSSLGLTISPTLLARAAVFADANSGMTHQCTPRCCVAIASCISMSPAAPVNTTLPEMRMTMSSASSSVSLMFRSTQEWDLLERDLA